MPKKIILDAEASAKLAAKSKADSSNQHSANTSAVPPEINEMFGKIMDRLDKIQGNTQPSVENEYSFLLDELWEKYVEFKTKTVSVTTLEKDFKRVGNHIKQFPFKNLQDARKIRRYISDNFTPETAKRLFMQVKACCKWGFEEQFIPDNPFDKIPAIRKPKTISKINPFSESEKERIINAFASHKKWNFYAPFVQFLFLTGCRTSEAVGLQWKDISQDVSIITFREAVVERRRKDTKTHTIRKFPINQKLKELILSIRPTNPQPQISVFLSETGLTIDAHNFLNRAWRPIVKSLHNVEYRPQYNTRHTFITMCLESGIEVAQVALWVGNSSKTIWAHYAGVTKKNNVPEHI